MKRKYYLIGNAHLDPVWMWQWQEGCSEAKATVRSALDRMKEYPDFIFTCAAAVLYKWIEEITPEMFEEVKVRISEGRWRLAGGWWVQPDCNLPSGESFVRHALYSQRYFKKKFGAVSHVGYNVDSFGHNNNLPQLLKKSGMDAYVFMRPMKHEKALESNVFRWRAPDGSTIPAFRLSEMYCMNFRSPEELDRFLGIIDSESNPEIPETMMFYGVGNHGGGPTKQNIELLTAKAAEDAGNEYIFASPDDFFAAIADRAESLPVVEEDLQHHASGCYSAYSMIKTLMRRSEDRLLESEALSLMSARLTGGAFPSAELKRGWEKTLFVQFHDSLGGCSIESVYPDMDEWCGEALSVSGDLANRARQRLGWRIDTGCVPEGAYPVVVFNPHGWSVRGTLRVNIQSEGVFDAGGAQLPHQNIESYTKACYGRCDTIFRAEVPAYGWRLYYIKAGGALSFAPPSPVTVSREDFTMENEFLRIRFERHTGYVTSIYDKKAGRETLSAPACVPVVADEFYHDTWSHGRNYFNNFIARFADAELEIIEEGPLRAVVRVTSSYNASRIRQYFALEAGCDRVAVSVRLDWQEEHKALKLEIPAAVEEELAAVYETPYASITRPADGEEEPTQKWVALCGRSNGEERSFALLNDCKYSFSMEGNVIRMMAARGCVFGDHGNQKSDENNFTDRGEQNFKYVLCPCLGALPRAELSRLAAELNTPLSYIFESRHLGELPVQYAGAETEQNGVILSVLKPAEDGNGYVLRAYEAEGKATDVEVSLPIIGCESLSLRFEPYEIRTLRIAGGEAREILMTELE